MILLDTSGLLAALFVDQREHRACAAALAAAKEPLLLSPFVLAELDYLVTRLGGVQVELALLAEVARQAYTLVPLGAAEVERARAVVATYSDLGLGLADASLVVLSERFHCLDLLTLDHRHFRAVRGYRSRPFRLLPADD